jgi:protein-S-isoprenylcysteine O-methyltransferase Ste14
VAILFKTDTVSCLKYILFVPPYVLDSVLIIELPEACQVMCFQHPLNMNIFVIRVKLVFFSCDSFTQNRYEEFFLKQFFGSEYDEYAQRVHSGIPFIK